MDEYDETGGISCPNCNTSDGFRTCDTVLCADNLYYNAEENRWFRDDAKVEVFLHTQTNRSERKDWLLIECLSCGFEFETKEVGGG